MRGDTPRNVRSTLNYTERAGRAGGGLSSPSSPPSPPQVAQDRRVRFARRPAVGAPLRHDRFAQLAPPAPLPQIREIEAARAPGAAPPAPAPTRQPGPVRL